MIRSPLPNWQWRYMSETDRLGLMLAPDDIFLTSYEAKKLTIPRSFSQPITMDETGDYHEFADILQQILPELSEPLIFHIVVHAVAAKHFHKSIANKSWLLKKQEPAGPLMPVVSVETELEQAIALILEEEGGFATLMLLSEGLKLNESKELERFQLIKTSTCTLNPSIPK